jgi:formylglycine-generating enzyme required for sulfatase activity
MSYCLNPTCQLPDQIGNNTNICAACGAELLLQNRYRPMQPLGRGGFGKTFKAIDEGRPGQPYCVLKQFSYASTDPSTMQTALAMFYEEASHLEALGDHPQIPELLAYFDLDKQPYLVEQYIDGQDLAYELKLMGPFSQSKIQDLLRSLLPVLDFLHNQPIPVIHRDLKPANIIRQSSDGTLLLVDFGAAKLASQTMLAKTGTMIGSPEYCAPEQMRGKPSFASDIFSLGVTCINLLTATPPFDLYSPEAETDWVWRDYLNDNMVDQHLALVLDKMIVQNLAGRYRSAAAVLQALDGDVSEYPASITTDRSKFIGKFSQDIFTFETAQFVNVSIEKAEIIKKPGWLGIGEREEVQINMVEDLQLQKSTGQAERFAEDLGNGVQLEMVYVPKGSFTMGSDESEDEKPLHLVGISDFYMGRYQITQKQYLILMGENPAKWPGAQLPVEQVSWHDAQFFCEQLSARAGKEYRLPSEAEWEYACRAMSNTPFNFGETIDTNIANYNGGYIYQSGREKVYGEAEGIYRESTVPVDSFPANDFGLSQMHGNLWEWCADEWGKYPGAEDAGSKSSWSPADARIIRGGSWYNVPNHCRSAFRNRESAQAKNSQIGFRVVCEPD